MSDEPFVPKAVTSVVPFNRPLVNYPSPDGDKHLAYPVSTEHPFPIVIVNPAASGDSDLEARIAALEAAVKDLQASAAVASDAKPAARPVARKSSAS